MKWGKVILVIFGAVLLTALGIDAADTISGSQGTLLSQVIRTSTGPCPSGMVEVENNPSFSCVDVYEASPDPGCPISDPSNSVESSSNISNGNCTALSQEGAIPWRFVTREQAMQLCARSSKRLPTSAEWYSLTLGMSEVEDSCNVSTGRLSRSGEFERCTSPHGTYDLIGNVWEWVSDDVIDGRYNDRTLPETGYVAQVDGGGMATVSTSTETELFGKDYFWSRADGAYGIIRGGYHDSDSDAGMYVVHADTPPNTAGIAIGFRCVQ